MNNKFEQTTARRVVVREREGERKRVRERERGGRNDVQISFEYKVYGGYASVL